jgi:NAD(P)-dependent dehydrogenase (short-subunit alcohol dehydrogenase family)
MAVTCDITKMEDIKSSIGAIMDAHGKIDIAVNATGLGLLAQFEETTEEELNMMMDLQFKGPYQWMQALGGRECLIPSSIIQISSATATILVGNHHAYIGTKAGIDHVVRGVADEYGAKGIRVNSISPGLTASPMACATPWKPPGCWRRSLRTIRWAD